MDYHSLSHCCLACSFFYASPSSHVSKMRSLIRRVLRSAAFALFFFSLLRLFGIYKQQPREAPLRILSFSPSLVFQNTEDSGTTDEKAQEIYIAAAVCGNRSTLSLAMMKSALIMCSNFIRFTLFVDSETKDVLNGTIRLWPANVLNRMSLDLRQISFPDDGTNDWKQLFKLCASERLFLPSLLKEVESVLYVDADTVFLSSPLHIWQHLGKMNETHMVGLGPGNHDYVEGWYPRLGKHPYYGKFGVNSGMMLMNLRKMRKFGWEEYVIRLYEQYKTRITFGDQDLINVVFHFHPEKLYVFPCNYNFIPPHCSVRSLCKEAEEQGIYILHGFTDVFVNDRIPALKAIYTSIQQHSFGDNLQMLFVNMNENLMKTGTSSCSKVMTSVLNIAKGT